MAALPTFIIISVACWGLLVAVRELLLLQSASSLLTEEVPEQRALAIPSALESGGHAF